MDNLLRRLDRLEHQNRRLKRIGALVVVGVTALVLMGQAKTSKVAKVIEAEKFILRDTNGEVRVALVTLDDGNSALVLFDKGGRMRVRLDTASFGGVGLNLFDKDGKGRAALSLTPIGMPILSLAKRIPERSPRLILNQSSLVLLDKDDKVIWRAP